MQQQQYLRNITHFCCRAAARRDMTPAPAPNGRPPTHPPTRLEAQLGGHAGRLAGWQAGGRARCQGPRPLRPVSTAWHARTHGRHGPHVPPALDLINRADLLQDGDSAVRAPAAHAAAHVTWLSFTLSTTRARGLLGARCGVVQAAARSMLPPNARNARRRLRRRVPLLADPLGGIE